MTWKWEMQGSLRGETETGEVFCGNLRDEEGKDLLWFHVDAEEIVADQKAAILIEAAPDMLKILDELTQLPLLMNCRCVAYAGPEDGPCFGCDINRVIAKATGGES